jgi:hypothetical protein
MAGTPSTIYVRRDDRGCHRSLCGGANTAIPPVLIARFVIVRASGQAVELAVNEAGETPCL